MRHSKPAVMLDKSFSVNDRGQIDHATAPTRAALQCSSRPHASPRYRADDEVTIQTYYYGRQSILNSNHNPNP